MIKPFSLFRSLSLIAAISFLTGGPVLSVCAQSEGAENIPDGFKLLYSQSFEAPDSLDDFVFTDPSAWQRADDELGQSLELIKQSIYEPPFRSPVNMALIKGLQFEDFIMEVNLLQTGRVYGHQDMCIFFGFQDPAHFYYSHIAVAPDDNAHNIFLVKDAPRTNIATNPEKGVTWGSNIWHKVRVERNAGSGLIKVFYDDMKTPIYEATDQNFLEGHIGFGSFDDVGKVDNIRIWGPEAKRTELNAFSGK